MLLVTVPKVQRQLADHVRSRRLGLNLTQAGLSERSGVALPTLRKFEQQGSVSLETFLKLLMVVGGLDEMLKAVQPTPMQFRSIDEVLSADNSTTRRKRGRSK